MRPGSLAVALCLLETNPMPWLALEQRLDITRNTLLYHLQHLEKAGIVVVERRPHLWARLVDPESTRRWVMRQHPDGLRSGVATAALWRWTLGHLARNRAESLKNAPSRPSKPNQ
jgi:DNA-binding HxlR family transcriptional regulator